jgi:hydroxymethylglutaryl-CoA lyase
MKIQIVEVGPRDGLQNEKALISIDDKLEIIDQLVNAGIKRIEVGAFVSPQWVPQMQGSEDVLARLERKYGSLTGLRGVEFSVLVPNEKGMERALKAKVKSIAVFGACSESFSKKNINCSIEESFLRFANVCKVAKAKKIKVRGYLSVAFGCPYEGSVSIAKVVKLTKRMLALGVFEVSIGDTIGVGTPKQVEKLVKAFKKARIPLNKIAMHFHNTRGTALANVLMALQNEITVFDSSVGGMGGCPYAKGASGNLSTEDLIYMLHGMGYKTGVDLKKLVHYFPSLQALLGRELPSLTGRASL